MGSIKSGSQEHLDSFANIKLKNYFENKWDTEINVLLATDKLRKAKEKLEQAEARLNKVQEKFENKEFPDANAGRKAVLEVETEKQQIEEEINALNNMILRDTETVSNHQSIIEKTQQWVKDNGKTE